MLVLYLLSLCLWRYDSVSISGKKNLLFLLFSATPIYYESIKIGVN